MVVSVDRYTAECIWDTLVKYCGAQNEERLMQSFIQNAVEGRWTEWRFYGNLGRGSKVWNANGRFYVTCYPEDETFERLLAIEDANKELAEIFKETHG